jgi:hypothetical protein
MVYGFPVKAFGGAPLRRMARGRPRPAPVANPFAATVIFVTPLPPFSSPAGRASAFIFAEFDFATGGSLYTE